MSKKTSWYYLKGPSEATVDGGVIARIACMDRDGEIVFRTYDLELPFKSIIPRFVGVKDAISIVINAKDEKKCKNFHLMVLCFQKRSCGWTLEKGPP